MCDMTPKQQNSLRPPPLSLLPQTSGPASTCLAPGACVMAIGHAASPACSPHTLSHPHCTALRCAALGDGGGGGTWLCRCSAARLALTLTMGLGCCFCLAHNHHHTVTHLSTHFRACTYNKKTPFARLAIMRGTSLIRLRSRSGPFHANRALQDCGTAVRVQTKTRKKFDPSLPIRLKIDPTETDVVDHGAAHSHSPPSPVAHPLQTRFIPCHY